MLAAVPMAYRMRGRIRGKRSVTILLLVPITLGSVLMAQGLLAFLGPAGWVNRLLIGLGLVDQPVRFTYNYWGVLFCRWCIAGFPFAFLLHARPTSRGSTPASSGRRRRWAPARASASARSTLPLLAPGLATTFCLSFVLAFSVFPSAVLVGAAGGRDAGDRHRGLPGGVREVRLLAWPSRSP